ncbi:RNA polymerase-binding protein DksA [Hydrogenothermus marinus]|uniref:TraR/DksA family transcriptional regulator n=1 Tax=Hydrogenothermus marinus TaxID=133270 RepID=A0A3M0BN09_9AQUI|nr:RNA polymerase-binding protein DksA [Hydrogenothermus marinus]RMA97916.1 TraR/DksA family transcriptional regulator [Hydrogenothermus marinus]
MEHLTPEQIEEIKNSLLEWKKQILKESKEAVGEPLSYEGGDEIDRADTEAGRFLTLRNLDRDRKVLKKIEYSLRKIEAGTYGICEVCGAEIPFERLKARPVANLCIKCKEIEEENE